MDAVPPVSHTFQVIYMLSIPSRLSYHILIAYITRPSSRLAHIPLLSNRLALVFRFVECPYLTIPLPAKLPTLFGAAPHRQSVINHNAAYRLSSSAINSSSRSCSPFPSPSFSHSPLPRCSGSTGFKLMPRRSCIEVGIADDDAPCPCAPAVVASPGAGVPAFRLRLTLRETPPLCPGDRDLPPTIPSAGLTVPGRWSGSPAAPEVRSERGSTRRG